MARGPLADVTTTVVFAAALLVSPVGGGATGGVRGGLAALVLAGLSVVCGRAICRWLPLERNALFELIAGFLSVSLVHLAATAVLNVDALVALGVDIIVVAALAATTLRSNAATLAQVSSTGARVKGLDLVVLLACSALAAYWSRESIAAVATARDTGVFNAWRDFLLHASEITYLRDYPGFGGDSPYLGGFDQPLYHRASYALPALYSAVAGVPSLDVATTFWMPTGVMLCALATYIFGSALGGPVGGAAAVAMLFLFPDASTYGFQNRFLSFHWLLQIAGGSGYAIALTMLALTVTASSASGRQAAALAGASALVVAGAAFKVQVALTAVGMVALLAVFAQRPAISRNRIVTLLSVVGLAGLAVWIESTPIASHLFTGRANPVAFLEFVHGQAARSRSVYTWLTGGSGEVWTFLAGYLLFLTATLGVILPAIVGLGLAYIPTRMGWRVAAIPVALVLSHIGMSLLVPTPAHGDVTETGHRSFVLLYAVLGAIVGAAVARMVAEVSVRWFGTHRPAFGTLAVLGLAGLAVPYIIGPTVQQRWTPRFATVPMREDTLNAGAFVRRQSTRGELVLAASEDPLALHVALTERGAFLARSDLYRRVNGVPAAMVRERSAEHATLARASTFESLQAFGRRAGVRWYIADTPATRQWPPAIRQRCSYCGETIQVYDLR